MNERIKELKEQALIWAVETLDPDALNDNEWGVAIDEKFAELIVRECMDLASAEQKRYVSITHRDMSECAVAVGNFSLLMKEHFGVEE